MERSEEMEKICTVMADISHKEVKYSLQVGGGGGRGRAKKLTDPTLFTIFWNTLLWLFSYVREMLKVCNKLFFL